MVKKCTYCGLIALLAVAIIACNGNRNTQSSTNGADSAINKIPKIDLYKDNYKIMAVKGNDTAFKTFKNEYTAAQQHIILALNRVDFNNFNQVDSLVIPDSIWGDINSYTPFPLKIKELDSVPKMVFFAYPIQAFAAYEHGNLVRWGPSSMGSKAHPTKTGLAFTNWKAEEHISTADDEWILKWNFNIHNKEGIGWHQYSMPGHPASHSCLRLLENDAKWLYDWADEWIVEKDQHVLAEGTPVIVFGAYDFDGEKPWLKLAQDPNADKAELNDISNELEPNLAKIAAEQHKREQVVATQKDSI